VQGEAVFWYQLRVLYHSDILQVAANYAHQSGRDDEAVEYLRDLPTTGGLLPRVIASYNAGPAPIAQWNIRFDQSDPLLFIETIPYWETRGYVPIVLRNYWIYEEQAADRSVSRRALVQQRADPFRLWIPNRARLPATVRCIWQWPAFSHQRSCGE
jgi:hypothetical protein